MIIQKLDTLKEKMTIKQIFLLVSGTKKCSNLKNTGHKLTDAHHPLTSPRLLFRFYIFFSHFLISRQINNSKKNKTKI